MVIFLQEDHELPVVGGTMRIRGGSIQEPAKKVGLVDAYGAVWRTGGTTSGTGDELDDFLETRAAKVETGGGADSTTISFNCLKDKLDEVFPVFLEVLREPAFRADKLELAKTQMNTDIARRNDDIGEIAGREAVRLAYGRDNPYARIPEYSTVAALTRDDLVQWHETFVHPNNIILGVSGDFDPKAMERVSARPSHPGPGAGRAPAQDRLHDPETRAVLHRKRRREPERHPHGHPRHPPQQSRLLRRRGDERRLRRRLFLAPVQDHPHRKRPGVFRGRRHRRSIRPPGIFRLAMGTKSATTGKPSRG